MNNMAEAYGVLVFGIGLVIMVTSVFLFLLPFFVFKIRNQVIEMNKKMNQIIELLGGRVTDSKYKICPKCQAKNRLTDYNCVSCGGPLL